MIILDCEQGSPEWHDARLGIPTASQFSRIVTATGKASAARERYMADLLAEWVLGEPADGFQNDDMDRGNILERHARNQYAWQVGCKPDQVGICLTDNRMVGYSPDSLIFDFGGEADDATIQGVLEIKCPIPAKHLMWTFRGMVPTEHFAQVQGGLWLTQAEWADFYSYHPELPSFMIRVEPDPVYHKMLDKHMPSFVEELMAGRQRLIDVGVVRKDVTPGATP